MYVNKNNKKTCAITAGVSMHIIDWENFTIAYLHDTYRDLKKKSMPAYQSNSHIFDNFDLVFYTFPSLLICV